MHKNQLLFFGLIQILLQFTIAEQLTENERILQPKEDAIDKAAEQEYRIQQQLMNEKDAQLEEWLAKEFQQNNQFPELQTTQSLIVALRSNVTYDFRLEKQLDSEKRIQLTILSLDSEGELYLISNPTQQQYVEVQTKDTKEQKYLTEGKVYVTKIFPLQMRNEEKYLQVRNNGDMSVIVVLDIEEQNQMMNVLLSDDKFTLNERKMSTILEEAKSTELKRQHIYKWEMGFFEMHYRLEYDMLCLTGAELLLIFVTSAVQMYCIKKLVDDELII